MATFNTRIQSKIDTYAKWMENDPVLLNGEIAIATVPASTGAVKQEPAILMKVGNGTDKFSALPFTSAKAADVAAWALADTKPTYEADEIVGLTDYINGEIQDSNTTYNLVQDTTDAHILILQKKEIGETSWTEVTRITTVDSKYDTQIAENAAAISALSGLVGTTAVADQIGAAIDALKLSETYDAKGAAASAETAAKAYADGLAVNYDSKGSAAAAEAAAKAYADGLADNYDAKGSAAEAEAAAKAYADGLAGNYDAKGAAEAVKSELQGSINTLGGQVSANSDAIEVLNGTGEGSVDAKIDAAFNEFSTRVTDDNVVNSYKELIDYAAEHGGEFTTLVGKVDGNTEAISGNAAKISANESAIGVNAGNIQANADAIDALEELVGTDKVADQISAAIAAEKIAETYATKEALNTTNGNVTSAQNTANDAVAAAAAAQGTADEAVAAAGDAQTAADEAKAAAATAQGTADKGVAAAGAAQTTADEAKAAASQANAAISALHQVASTGDIADLEQDAGTYVIFNCGSSSACI